MEVINEGTSLLPVSGSPPEDPVRREMHTLKGIVVVDPRKASSHPTGDSSKRRDSGYGGSDSGHEDGMRDLKKAKRCSAGRRVSGEDGLWARRKSNVSLLDRLHVIHKAERAGQRWRGPGVGSGGSSLLVQERRESCPSGPSSRRASKAAVRDGHRSCEVPAAEGGVFYLKSNAGDGDRARVQEPKTDTTTTLSPAVPKEMSQLEFGGTRDLEAQHDHHERPVFRTVQCDQSERPALRTARWNHSPMSMSTKCWLVCAFLWVLCGWFVVQQYLLTQRCQDDFRGSGLWHRCS